MTPEEMNDWYRYYGFCCPACGCLWFHEPHKDGCSIAHQQKQQIENTQRLMRVEDEAIAKALGYRIGETHEIPIPTRDSDKRSDNDDSSD